MPGYHQSQATVETGHPLETGSNSGLGISPELLDRIKTEVAKGKDEQEKMAEYKIQIVFSSDRSIAKPVSFSLSFWESGKRLHGGGDEMMFICRRHADAPRVTPKDIVVPNAKATERGCDGLISGGLTQGGILVCPHCHTKHTTDQVGDSVFYRCTSDQAAHILAHWWRKLGHKADLYSKFTPTDPRTIAMRDTYGWQKARELRGLTIYPLARIIEDTSVGATVESRFKAFLLA